MPFNPNNYGEGGGTILWLDAAQGVLNASSGVVSNGEKVEYWEDQSGLGHTFTSFDDNSATYITDAINGHPVLRFPGDKAGYNNYNGTSAPHINAVTAIYVFKSVTGYVDQLVLLYGDSVYARLTLGTTVHDEIRFEVLLDTASWSAVETTSYTLADNVYIVSAAGYGYGNLRLWVNNTLADSSFVSTDFDTVYSSSFAGQYVGSWTMSGDIAEIVIWDELLSDTDIYDATQELINKYLYGYSYDVYDTFADYDWTLLDNHTTDTGHLWENLTPQSGVHIYDNRVFPSGNPDSAIYTIQNVTKTNVEIWLNLPSGGIPLGSDIGIVFRAEDSENYWEASYQKQGATDYYRLRKYVGGSAIPVINAEFTPPIGDNLDLHVLASSDYIAIDINGSGVSTYDSTYYGNTKHGFYLAQDDSTHSYPIDNFRMNWGITDSTSGVVNNDCNLFIQGFAPTGVNNWITLALPMISGYVNDSLDLHIYSLLPDSGNLDLYMWGHIPSSSTFTMYTEGMIPASSDFVDLYTIASIATASGWMPLTVWHPIDISQYPSGYWTGDLDLFLQVPEASGTHPSGTTPGTDYMPLTIGGTGTSTTWTTYSGTVTLITIAEAITSGTVPLYLKTTEQDTSSITLYLDGVYKSNDNMTLAIPGTLGYKTQNTTLYSHGF